MRHGRILDGGQVLQVRAHDGRVLLPDGQLRDEDQLHWLVPFDCNTVFALGLNYADHARELTFSRAPQEPLVFLKGPNALTGHRQTSYRPPEVRYMHYECELGVVIGRRCRHVAPARAYEVVAGYCVANDYTIRDYVENYFRPNARAKNRDGCTPVGPWLVDAADVADPMDLRLRSWVDGQLTQQGRTRDMVFDVPSLIAHLSGFMTLDAGDLILTGTPEGVADCRVGAEVVTEVEGIGRLVNTIVDRP